MIIMDSNPHPNDSLICYDFKIVRVKILMALIIYCDFKVEE